MSKAVLISIQPYWAFLIIAKSMGWNYPGEKTIEVRKNYPSDEEWNRVVEIYCSKDKKSFNQIPKEYQPLMKELLGKVIGEFVCDGILDYKLADVGTDVGTFYYYERYITDKPYELNSLNDCLTDGQLLDYGNYRDFIYGWHISDLVIYDEPRELNEFCVTDKESIKQCANRQQVGQPGYKTAHGGWIKGSYYCIAKDDWCDKCKTKPLTRPPQSWCYIEDMEGGAE